MNEEYRVSVGSGVLGRILNFNGEPIDGEGTLNAEMKPTLIVDVDGRFRSQRKYEPGQLFETGIKPFDLFAPVPRDGIVSLVASWGVGKVVLLHELIRTMKIVHKGKAVVITVAGGPRELEDMKASYRESGVLDSMTAILLEEGASNKAKRQAVLNGLTIAHDWLENHHENLLFIVDQLALDRETVKILREWPPNRRGSSMTVISGFYQDEIGLSEELVSIEPDAQIVFSTNLARQGLYPAIDPFTSSSQLFDAGVIDARHMRVKQETVELLKKGRELLQKSSELLSEEELRLIEQAKRIERFLTQPFYVAQLHNGIPGQQVPLAETLNSLEAMLNGLYDHVPVKDFAYIGGIDQLKLEV